MRFGRVREFQPTVHGILNLVLLGSGPTGFEGQGV